MPKVVFHRHMIVGDSDIISEMAYNIDTKQMLVVFSNGSKYLYNSITLAQFSTIVGAQSVGSTFNKMKAAFLDYKKVE